MLFNKRKMRKRAYKDMSEMSLKRFKDMLMKLGGHCPEAASTIAREMLSKGVIYPPVMPKDTVWWVTPVCADLIFNKRLHKAKVLSVMYKEEGCIIRLKLNGRNERGRFDSAYVDVPITDLGMALFYRKEYAKATCATLERDIKDERENTKRS